MTIYVVKDEITGYRRKEVVFDVGDFIVILIIIAFKNNDDLINNFSKLDGLGIVSPVLQVSKDTNPRYESMTEA